MAVKFRNILKIAGTGLIQCFKSYQIFLKTILSSTGSQWRSLRVSVMWSRFLTLTIIRAAAFWTNCNLTMSCFRAPKRRRITKVQLRANKTVNKNFCGTFPDVFSYFRNISYVIEGILNYCIKGNLDRLLARVALITNFTRQGKRNI